MFSFPLGSVQSLAFSPCGRYLASGSWCGTVCIWDLAAGTQLGQLGGQADYHSTGYRGRSSLGSSRLADETTGLGEADLTAPSVLSGPVVSLAFCPVVPGGAATGYLAAGSLEGAVRIWDTGTGRTRTTHIADTQTSVVSIALIIYFSLYSFSNLKNILSQIRRL
ncbi:unnamed protein product [Protopolystoma xenopodis]|uniref:Uncharacterized protein n=1 Tax=Protopolystoma xenopodis TaxID=117903 RepID=A0A3S5AS12_9PLAT|nr:unnamed protein product [Protopolystoma xenopodis]